VTTYLEAWEATAQAFYDYTGYLRPGKDVPAVLARDTYEEERKAAWDEWRRTGLGKAFLNAEVRFRVHEQGGAVEAKFVEVRDSGTFIPALAVKVQDDGSDDAYLARRGGWGVEGGVLLARLIPEDVGRQSAWSAFDWGSNPRTMQVAHLALQGLALESAGMVRERVAACAFDAIECGAVVDVEWLLGLTEEPKRSEREPRGGR